MFILLPAFYFLAKSLYNYCTMKRKLNQVVHLLKEIDLDLEQDLKFDPPVYRLRYAKVYDIVLEEVSSGAVKKIVEFGCAEMKLFEYIKNIFELETILLVDIDEETLRDNLFRIQPQTTDYLDKRRRPLEVMVFSGSISDPDCNLNNSDLVIGIEIIEHLYPDVLEALPHNIFGYIQPQVVILSTPNADFNVLFKNFKGFRHADHKFEWTREQFMSWALNIVNRYPEYTVSFTGVGEAPIKYKSLGFCSQIAIFRRTNVESMLTEVPDHSVNTQNRTHCDNNSTSFGVCTYFSYSKQIHAYESILKSEEHSTNDNYNEASNIYYKLIDKVEFPFEVDNRTIDEISLDEMKYNIYRLGHMNGIFYVDETYRSEIPLYVVVKNIKGQFVTEDYAIKILQRNGFVIENCLVNGSEEICVIYEPIMDSNNSSPFSDFADDEDDQDNLSPLNGEENWNLEYTDSVVVANSNYLSDQKGNMEFNNNNTANCSKQTDVGTSSPKKSVFKKGTQQKASKVVSINDGNEQELKNWKTIINMQDERSKIYTGASTSSAIPSHISTEPVASTSYNRKKKKRKIESEEDVVKEEIKHMTKTIIYNTLNSMDGMDSSNDTSESKILQISADHSQTSKETMQCNDHFDDARSFVSDNDKNTKEEKVNERELAHASCEALFDPNSEVSMLEDFVENQETENWEQTSSAQENASQSQLALFGMNVNNEDEDDVLRLPINANPFPNWLLQLLSANAIEAGTESHDEPHFYCQGDGIGVHPSIVEVDMEDELSSSDSSSNEDDAEQDASEPDLSQIPEDPFEVIGVSLESNASQSSIPQTSSTNDSADEFYDTVDDPMNGNNLVEER